MSSFRLRTNRSQPLPRDRDTLVLDWFTGSHRQRSTVATSGNLLTGLAPTAAALDLFRLGGAVYCIDKIVPRAEEKDAWTRDLALDAPVRSTARWRSADAPLTEALSFLSGDHWEISFRSGADDVRGRASQRAPDAICLFSGGLDSLVGAIDLLEAGNDVILVGHFESGFTGGVQEKLYRELRRAYGNDGVRLRQLRLGPAGDNRLQARPLPEVAEITTRARSFLFVAAGLVVASAFGDDIPMYMPENGFIGINVPFVASRAGSLSTRTTHPHFLERLESAMTAAGIRNQVVNPFRLKTKGEVVADCANGGLLQALGARSISCAHPEAARWKKLPPSNCGYCYPCLIRRAALHRVGLDGSESYQHDVLTEVDLLDEQGGDTGADVRAVLRGLAREPKSTDVLRNGPVPEADAAAFDDVHRRGRRELRDWLAGGSAELKAALGLGSEGH